MVLLVINFIDVFDSILKGKDHMADLGAGYIIFMAVYVIFTVVALFSRRELIHGIIVIVINLYQIWYLLDALSTLSY